MNPQFDVFWGHWLVPGSQLSGLSQSWLRELAEIRDPCSMASGWAPLLQESQQAAVVLGLFVALAAGTWTLVGPIFQFLQQLLPEGWCLEDRDGGDYWREVVWKLLPTLPPKSKLPPPRRVRGSFLVSGLGRKNWKVEGTVMRDDGMFLGCSGSWRPQVAMLQVQPHHQPKCLGFAGPQGGFTF